MDDDDDEVEVYVDNKNGGRAIKDWLSLIRSLLFVCVSTCTREASQILSFLQYVLSFRILDSLCVS